MSPLIEKYALRGRCCAVKAADDANSDITGPCYSCKKPQTVQVKTADLTRFRGGTLAQDCFPYLAPEQREFLISGICSTCWDEMFLPEDEDDSDE